MATKFFALEGGEGSGKSSVLDFLKGRLSDTVFTREPGGTPLAEKIRGIVLGEEGKILSPLGHFCLFFAARAHHLELKIRPALEAGKLVITDRFAGSTFAYQIHGQEHSELKEPFWEMYKAVVGETEPHYIFLDVPVEIGLKRRRSQAEQMNHFDAKDIAFHERIRTGYHEFMPKVSSTTIDAQQPLEKVCADVLAVINQLSQ